MKFKLLLLVLGIVLISVFPKASLSSELQKMSIREEVNKTKKEMQNKFLNEHDEILKKTINSFLREPDGEKVVIALVELANVTAKIVLISDDPEFLSDHLPLYNCPEHTSVRRICGYLLTWTFKKFGSIDLIFGGFKDKSFGSVTFRRKK